MKKHIPTLDGWRAIAIIFVIISHSIDSIQAYFNFSKFSDFSYIKLLGNDGVNIFFGISGFLITTLLVSEEKKLGKINLKNFYIKRCFRILPVSVVFLLVIGILSIMDVIHVTLKHWLLTTFFLGNFIPDHSWYLGHFWSLAVEQHFYIFFPIFFLLSNGKKRLAFALSASIFFSIWRVIDFKYRILSNAELSLFVGRTDIEAHYLLWGVTAAIAYSNESYKVHIIKILSSYKIFLGLLFIFIASSLITASFQILNWKLNFLAVAIEGVIIPILLLWTIINFDSIPSKILETRPLVYIGRISFSIYIWQQLFLVRPDRVDNIYLLQNFPLNLIAMFLCAFLSYSFIEKPLIKLGHQFVNKNHQ